MTVSSATHPDPAASAPRQGPVKPGRLTPPREVPAHIARPPYVGKAAPEPYTGSDVQDDPTVSAMRTAGRIAAGALHAVGQAIAPGVTTDELDRIGHEFIINAGAYPSPLGYRGFPKSLCTSINEVICHGIPDSTVLHEGDIVNIDITVFIGGVHGDTDATFAVGQIDEESQQLLERTQEALRRGIAAVKPGREINVIGRVIESYAKRFHYGVVRDYTGHGIHTAFHSGLVIPHYDHSGYTTVMEPGMTFTIEPMFTLGTVEWDLWEDNWTVVTKDGKRSAQYEHTIVVTDTGSEILTTLK